MKNVTVLSGVQMKWFSVLAGMFCLVFATGASAAGTRPCADDAARLCQGMKPGGGAVAKCLKEHSSELSSACKGSMAKTKARARAKAKSFKQACGQDARKFCKDEKRGGGRIMRCLALHQEELSPACKEMLDQPIGGPRQ